MRTLLLSFLLIAFSAASNVYSGTCRYGGSYVYEAGYDPRPMTANEVDQLRNYGTQWSQYGIQKGQYARGQNSMPTPPTLPCFCHNCY